MIHAIAFEAKGSERRRSRLGAWMWVLLCMLAVPACQLLRAQASAGLTGRVTDPSGAAIAGAHITFTNEATGIKSQYAASSVGIYVAPLPDGTYDISVEAMGFQKFEQTHVVVEVGAQTTDNIQLSLGSSSQTVEVSSANSIGLDTTDPQLDSMLPAQEVTDLPLQINGYIRQITSFAALAPGVRVPTSPNEYGTVEVEGGAPNQINASGNYYNGLQIDTASNENSDPPYEMVDQFRVIRNLFSARYGMVQGATDYAMREGSNKLHGDGFLIDRNSFFDSDGFFPVDNGAGKPVPPEDVQSDWGGTIGGPVVIPHLYNGHNKTFFLGSIDLFNWKQGQTAFGSVPTQAMVGGDFTNFVNSNGQQIPIYDPTTGQQFMGCNGNQPNVICSNRIDPLSATLLKYIPAPNATGTDYGLQNNEAPAIPSITIQNRAWGVTLNHQISQSQNISFTWWNNHYYEPQIEESSSAAIVPANNPLAGMEDLTDNANVWLANYSKTMTPNLVMTAGIAAQDKWQNNQNANTNVSFAGILGGTTMPHISFNGQEAPTGWGNSNSDIVLYHVNNIGWNLFNNWMWNKGRHTFNIGGEFHHYYANDLSNYSGGQFSFSQAETSIPNTTNSNFSQYGSSFASFLLGLPDSASRTSSATTAINTQAYSAYIQDDIKLTNRLTLNAGLRYDLMLPYTMAQNNDVFLNASTPSSGTVNPATGNGLAGWATEYGNCASCAGYNQVGIHNLNFGPRLGFAYSLDKNTVIQGGYTITYLGYAGAYGQGEGAYSNPNSMAGLLGGSYTLSSTGGYQSAYGEWTNTSGAAVPIPNVTPTPFSQSLGLAQTIYYVDYAHNGEAGHLQMWSLSLQRQLPWHTMLTIDYTANRVTHLSGYNINPLEQANPSILQYGPCLSVTIANEATSSSCTAQALNGLPQVAAPYANFTSQFKGSATVNQALKPFPQYSAVTRAWDQAGTAYFSAFQIQADKHLSNNINFLANIELPRLYDNLTTVVNKYNPQQTWGLDTEGSFESKTAVLYNLPFGQGQRWLNTGAAGKYAGDWQVSALLTYNNSQPLAITQSGESFMNGTNYPNINPNVRMWSGNYNKITKFFEGKLPTAPYLFSTNAFTNTGNEYVLGNANRDYSSIRGPWYPVENLSAKKLFHVTEGSYFTLRMDYFNALNRVQSPSPTTSLGSSNFGQVTSKFSATNREGQAELTFNF